MIALEVVCWSVYLWTSSWSCLSTEEEGEKDGEKYKDRKHMNAAKEGECRVLPTHTTCKPQFLYGIGTYHPSQCRTLTAETTTVARVMIAGRPVLRY
jgi:hypothetical protein